MFSKVLRGPLGPVAAKLDRLAFRWSNRAEPRFRCPLCRYRGPFKEAGQNAGVRKHAECPKCGALERHRLQVLVLERLAASRDFSSMSALHFAPEGCIRAYLKRRFKAYMTSDIAMSDVDVRADMRSLPFGSGDFDFIFASHVLEHIKDDDDAIREVARVLRPGGIAVLPVPIIAPDKTVEYPEPNPHEDGHVRSPGLDYFQRFQPHFATVRAYGSSDFSPVYQTYIYEDRSAWPADTMPLRPTSIGEKHAEYVPVCIKD